MNNQISLFIYLFIYLFIFFFFLDYTSLISLSVDETQIRSLSFLKNMTSLQLLSLKKTSISDEDIAHTASLRNLHILELQATQITSLGLTHLQGQTCFLFATVCFPHFHLKKLFKIKRDFNLYSEQISRPRQFVYQTRFSLKSELNLILWKYLNLPFSI